MTHASTSRTHLLAPTARPAPRTRMVNVAMAGAIAATAVGVMKRRRPPAASAELDMDAPPHAVYEVLADADRYADWVVSAKEVRFHDASWPAPGSTFHHTQGMGPLQLKDTTSVLEVTPDRELLLEVRGRPLMTANTLIQLTPIDAGRRTRVAMHERPTAGIVRAIHNPLVHAALKARNLESLRRLRSIVEDEVNVAE